MDKLSDKLSAPHSYLAKSGIDSLNETKLSFAQGFDYNSAVKFNEVLSDHRNEALDQPYYTFSTANIKKDG